MLLLTHVNTCEAKLVCVHCHQLAALTHACHGGWPHSSMHQVVVQSSTKPLLHLFGHGCHGVMALLLLLLAIAAG